MAEYWAERFVDSWLALFRIDDDGVSSQWTVDGWVRPAGVEWSGIGGATNFKRVTADEAQRIIAEFKRSAR